MDRTHPVVAGLGVVLGFSLGRGMYVYSAILCLSFASGFVGQGILDRRRRAQERR